MTDLEKIVNEVIREDCREEALEILKLSSKKHVDEFIGYYKADKGNICCLHLDYMKLLLVQKGLMKSGGCFGKPL